MTAVEAFIPCSADHCPGLCLSCPGLAFLSTSLCGPRPQLECGPGPGCKPAARLLCRALKTGTLRSPNL